jgi:nucleotide-binding universal stress UspA family protein
MIGTILCPVDFSDATERQVSFAVDLCRLLGARLVLEHNLGEVGPGAAVGWMWAASHKCPRPDAIATERLQRLMTGTAAGVRVEAKLTHGVPTSSVLRVAEFVKADLIILTAHGGSHDDHMSMSEQILERSPCSVLALHDSGVDHAVPRFTSSDREMQSVLVPASFSAGSDAAVEFAIELARRLPFELHLLHIEPSRVHVEEPDSREAEIERSRLRRMLPADLDERARIHVATGDPAREIALAAERIGAALIVMGEHTRAPIRRWLRRDISRAVLHHAPCPVWYVPSHLAGLRESALERTESLPA